MKTRVPRGGRVCRLASSGGRSRTENDCLASAPLAIRHCLRSARGGWRCVHPCFWLLPVKLGACDPRFSMRCVLSPKNAVERIAFSDCWRPLFKMADVFDPKKRSAVMSAIRSRGNRDTEVKLAKIFRAFGIIGWRRQQRLPGRPDFVFLRVRLAVFVDGRFWHGCPAHGRNPESNQDYWLPKLSRNRKRDRAVVIELRRWGWTVLRLWEHDLKERFSCATSTLSAVLPDHNARL